MRVGFNKGDFAALTALWNDCLPESFRIDEKILRQNTIESPSFDWGASCIEVDDDTSKPLGFVAVSKSHANLHAGPDPDQAFLCAIVCPDSKLGVDLMAYVKRVLRNRGVYNVCFGQGHRHFFPGCPRDMTSLRDFLIIEGFQEGEEIYDLELELSKLVAKPSVDGAEVRPLRNDEMDKLEVFLRSEFPGRWTYDTLNKMAVEGRCDFVYGLFVRDEVVGFAVTQSDSHKVRIGGAVFAPNGGGSWMALGPIGVSAQHRGRGLGDHLLSATLQHAASRGVTRCVVDWTGIRDWYERHGFSVSQTYQSFVLSLGEDEITGMTPPL